MSTAPQPTTVAREVPAGAWGGCSVPAPYARQGLPAVVTGLASTGLSGLLAGPVTAGRVVAAGPVAVYVAVGDRVPGLVALCVPEAIRLPAALVVDPALLLLAARAGTRVQVGGGAVTLLGRSGGAPVEVRIRPGRWWDPCPRLRPVDRSTLAGRLSAAQQVLPPWPGGREQLDEPVRTRLHAGMLALEAAAAGEVAPAALTEAAEALVGLGPGSTPAGDDLLAGALAAARLVGGALPAPGAVAFAAGLWQACGPLLARTTTLSAGLLAHAARGELAAPAAALCRALAGTLPLRPALDGLLAVGHTSGHDLAAGLLLGTRTALRHGGRRPGGVR